VALQTIRYSGWNRTGRWLEYTQMHLLESMYSHQTSQNRCTQSYRAAQAQPLVSPTTAVAKGNAMPPGLCTPEQELSHDLHPPLEQHKSARAQIPRHLLLKLLWNSGAWRKTTDPITVVYSRTHTDLVELHLPSTRHPGRLPHTHD
jgi:hypothetical protein